MQNLYFSLLFVLFSLKIAAQNWQPIPAGERLHFRHSDSVLVTHLVQIDSQQTLPGGQTRFFLNRVAEKCAACPTPFYLANRGQFFQKTMTQRPDGDYFFEGKRQFLLKTQIQQGEVWMFDTAANVEATAGATYLGSVLGEADSLQNIALSGGGAIILSKNHGVVRWPDFEAGGNLDLAGNETRALGEWMPNWRNFFDFAVGDVFQFEEVATLDVGTANNKYTTTKLRILEKTEDGDTLVYRIEHRSRTQLWGPLVQVRHDTFFKKFHPALHTAWSESWPGQVWKTTIQSSLSADTLLTVSHFFGDSKFGLSKSLGRRDRYSFSYCDAFLPPQPGQGDTLFCDFCFQFSELLSVGLGRTYHHFGCFEYFETEEMVGFVKNGDTTGIITPDSVLTSIRRVIFDPKTAQISPNPTRENWLIRFAEPPGEALRLRLFDAQGKLCRSYFLQNGSEKLEVEADGFPPGVYWLEMGGVGLRLVKF